MCACKTLSGGTKYVIHSFDNPGIILPKFIIDFFTKKLIPREMNACKEACKKYKLFVKKTYNGKLPININI